MLKNYLNLKLMNRLFAVFFLFLSTGVFSQTINWISPMNGDKGESLSVTISGSGVNFGSQYSNTLSDFRFTQFSTTTTFYGASTSASSYYLYGDVDIPCDVPHGLYDLEVYDNSTSSWIVDNDAFWINTTNPQVTCLSKNSTMQGDFLEVEISGVDLNYGNQYGVNPNVKFSQYSSTSFLYANVDSVNSCKIYGNLTIPYTQNTGFYDLEVYNNYSSPPFYDNINDALYIYPYSISSVDSISPSNGNLGQSLSVSISGSNIDYGNTCSETYSPFKLTRFDQFSGTNYEIFGTATGFYGSNLYGDISIPISAPQGLYDVSVWDNNDSNWVVGDDLFYVHPNITCSDHNTTSYYGVGWNISSSNFIMGVDIQVPPNETKTLTQVTL